MPKDESQARREIHRLAELLDSKFHLPFGWRIGWDGIIGLIPGVGDIATNLVSFYILYQAASIGCPPSVILRMALNILADNVLDMIPFIGNIFDFIWKSNLKNVQLMEDYLNNPHRTTNRSRGLLFLVFLFVLAVIIGSVALTILVAQWVWGLFQTAW